MRQAFNGVGAPKGTPTEIIAKLNNALNAALEDADIQRRFAQLGSVPAPMATAEFGKLIAGETAKWEKVLKSAGIKAE